MGSCRIPESEAAVAAISLVPPTEPEEILKVLSVSADVTHGYLLTIQSPSEENNGWHTIKVTTFTGPGGRVVRAREGYLLE